MKEAVNSKTIWNVPKSNLIKLKINLSASNLFVYAAGMIVLFIVACALFPQWIAPYSPTYMHTEFILSPPSALHLLGTDYFGRDVLSLVVYGSRDSLIIGVVSVLIGGGIGGGLGALSGYVGGVMDMIFMRFTDILMTIPGILLALAIAAALGPSLMNVVLAVAVSSIPGLYACNAGTNDEYKKKAIRFCITFHRYSQLANSNLAYLTEFLVPAACHGNDWSRYFNIGWFRFKLSWIRCD